MSHLTRPVRFLMLLLAAMQIAVPAAVSVADGVVASTERGSAAHIEAFGDNRCAPSHSAACLLCRFLSATIGSPAARPASAVTTDYTPSVPTLYALDVAATRRGFNPRAPPTLLA